MFDSRKVLLGIMPTCWANGDFPNVGLGDDIPFERCVDEIAKAGLQRFSIGHKPDLAVNEFRDNLYLGGNCLVPNGNASNPTLTAADAHVSGEGT